MLSHGPGQPGALVSGMFSSSVQAPAGAALTNGEPCLVRVGSPAPILEIRERPGSPVILFYPGSMLEPGHYKALLDAFYEQGFAVCGLHLSGHGQARHVARFTFGDLVQEGCAAEEWLAAHNKGSCLVVGHSQGAILTLAHAARSDRIAGAFAIAGSYPHLPGAIHLTNFTCLSPFRTKILSFADKMAKRWPRLSVPLPAYISHLKIRRGMRKPLATGQGYVRFSYPLEYLNSLFQAKIPTVAHCPVTLIGALNDGLFTPEIMRESFEAITAPFKRLAWLEDGGHTAALNPEMALKIAVMVKNSFNYFIRIPDNLAANRAGMD